MSEKNFLKKPKENSSFSETLEFMECVSTIMYYLKESPTLKDDEILRSIKMIKPYLSEYLCLSGLNEAKKLLFKSEYLTEELKEEIDAWERLEE